MLCQNIVDMQVRKHTAEQLYLKYLGEPSSEADSLTEVLLTATWDGSKEEAVAAQDMVAKSWSALPKSIVGCVDSLDRSTSTRPVKSCLHVSLASDASQK